MNTARVSRMMSTKSMVGGNPAAKIKTLVELAKRKELLVVKEEKGQRMLMTKVSIPNQIVVPISRKDVVG